MKLRKYVNNTLEAQDWKEISQNIFGYFIQKRLDLHPRNQCAQFDILNLDERGNILPCCCLPRDHTDYKLTNIFDENFMEVLGKWQPPQTCIECMNAGLSPLKTLGDSFSFTNFTVPSEPSEPSFVEVIYLVAKKIKRRLKMILHKVKKL
jgi:MoaA/NifB/PqqE/SkfB family radical SAM enzyme